MASCSANVVSFLTTSMGSTGQAPPSGNVTSNSHCVRQFAWTVISVCAATISSTLSGCGDLGTTVQKRCSFPEASRRTMA
eukprot:1435452-Prymnesium_polylepis.1